ncbi:glycosyltransferase [Treponema primitia]|uniref:glycosyltransferase n=1 Tax=Treponema primitia TaxID=88058 RepID=UPI00397F5E40
MTVVHVLEPFASGVTTAVINITKQLPKIKHIVIHGSRMWVDEAANVQNKFPPGVEFIAWPFADREINLIKDARALGALIRLLKPYRRLPETVIHLHSSKAGFLGRLACRLLGISRVIYTPHCAAFIRTDIGSLKRRLFRFLEKVGGWFGGTVVGCGKSEAEIYAPLGKKTLYVCNGVALTPIRKAPFPRLVSFVGIAGTQKDPALFNEIAAAFDADCVPFCWVGEGPLADTLKSKNCTITGWVDKQRVDSYLAETLVYLSTSAWEGLPFGVLEAMNGSCALLLRDVPGNRDLVNSGKNGYLFKDAREGIELLGRMLRDQAKTIAMGAKSRNMVGTDYSVEKMGEGYGTIYTALAVSS